MASPMQKVNEIVSGSIGDYLTNKKTWGNVMYIVLEHGLKGDGVTDDTAALQTLVNLAISLGRKAIFFPHTPNGGRYYVTNIVGGDQVVFFGDNAQFIGGYTEIINQIGAATDVPPPVSSIYFDVRDYGATGGGITDDTPYIEDAITAAGETGTVLFPPGTYLCHLTNLPRSVYFLGDGYAVLKGLTNQLNIVDLTGSQKDRITFNGLTFDGSNLQAGVELSFIQDDNPTNIEECYIQNCRFVNAPQGNNHAIQLTGVGYGVITKNYFEGFGGDVINCNAGRYITTNNIIIGIPNSDGGVAYNNAAMGTIANNYIRGTDLGIGCGPERPNGDSSPINITGNVIEACRYGVNLGYFGFAGMYEPIGANVHGNNIFKCKEFGIRFDGNAETFPGFFNCYGNVIDQMGTADYDGTTTMGVGIYIGATQECKVHGNIISRCSGAGIQVNTNYIDVTDNLLFEVSTGGTMPAIWCQKFRYGHISQNRIKESQNDGISVEIGEELNITNNTIEGCTMTGIEMFAAVTNYVMTGNTVKTCNRGIVIIGGGASNYWIIKHNIAHGNTTSNIDTGGYTIGETRILSENITY